MTCPKCGHDKESGPRYQAEQLVYPKAPEGSFVYMPPYLIAERLAYSCARCGWQRYEPTLEQQKQRPAPKMGKPLDPITFEDLKEAMDKDRGKLK